MKKLVYLLLFIANISYLLSQPCLTGGQQIPIINTNFTNCGLGADISTCVTAPTIASTGFFNAGAGSSGFGDGWYAIRNVVPSHNLWNAGFAGNGNFAIFNCDGAIANLYTQQVNSLCNNVSYTFSARFADICPGCGNPPEVKLEILNSGGTIVASNTLASVPSAWTTLTLNLPAASVTSSMTVRIRNTKSAGGGNDLALDDIIFSPSVVTSGAYFNSNTSTKTFSSPILSSVILNATTPTPTVPNINYQWEMSFNGGLFQPIAGATTVPYTYTTPNAVGTYIFRLRFASGANINSPNCRYTTDCITLTLNDPCDELCFWKLTGNNINGNRNILGTLTPHPIRVHTDGLERMRITEGGNAGIGTIDPIERLHVRDQAIFVDATPTGGNVSTGSVRLYSGSNAGNTGFIEFNTLNQQRIGAIGWHTNQLQYQANNNAGHIFQTQAGTNERMRITDAGRVGIGTDQTNMPIEKLHIHGNTTPGHPNIPASMLIENDNAGSLRMYGGSTVGNSGFIEFMTLNRQRIGAIGWGIDHLQYQTSNNAGHIFQTQAGTNERMRIMANGNVGIGTSNALNRTEINSQNMTNPTAASAGIDNGISGLRFTNLTNNSPHNAFTPDGVLSVDNEGDVIWVKGAGNGGGINSTCTIQGLIPGVGTNGSTDLVCSQIYDDLIAGAPNGGGVGINSVGPFFYLAWPGGITGPTLPPAAGLIALDVNGVTQSLAYIATSDENLKKNIQPIKNANEIVTNLNGKTYSWKDEVIKSSKVDAGIHYGFLAQEVEKTMPGAVIKDKNGKYGVEYNAFIPVLVESQKEVIKENEALKSEIASLKSDNELMKEKFALLEKTITQLCESGCEGLKKTGEGSSSQVDILYQSIPNPTDSEALINYSLSKEYTNAYITVSTQEGKLLKSVKLDSKKGSGSINLSLGELANGTYLYTLVAGERVIETKRLQILK